MQYEMNIKILGQNWVYGKDKSTWYYAITNIFTQLSKRHDLRAALRGKKVPNIFLSWRPPRGALQSRAF